MACEHPIPNEAQYVKTFSRPIAEMTPRECFDHLVELDDFTSRHGINIAIDPVTGEKLDLDGRRPELIRALMNCDDLAAKVDWLIYEEGECQGAAQIDVVPFLKEVREVLNKEDAAA